MERSKALILSLFAIALLGAVAAGCGAPEAALSKDEKENFKGGPPPANFAPKNGMPTKQ